MSNTINVTIRAVDQNSIPLANAEVTARLSNLEVTQDLGYVVQERATTITNSGGVAVLALWPNALGSTESHYVFTIRNPSNWQIETILATLPNNDCELHAVADLPPYPGKTEGQLAIEEAVAAVAPAIEAKLAAQLSATQAAASASAAALSAGSLNGVADAAIEAKDAAQISATSAAGNRVLAEAAATTATEKAVAAESNATTATSAASAANTYASTANTKANEALVSATNANNSAITSTNQATIASTQASIATTKASEASSSADVASTKATEANAAAINAQNAANSVLGFDLDIGTVTEGAASATITGASPNRILNLVLPRGLQGNDGNDGAAGASFTVNATGTLVGRTAYDTEPSGFSYLDTEAGNLYIRQGASGWSAAIPFGKGDKGDQGEPGIQGIKGDTGEPGAQGIQGIQGVAGNNGSNGTDGLDGKSAYQVALDNGFVGTEAAWLLSLKGATGDTGAAGLDGTDGINGTNGIDGVNGTNGIDGLDGLSAYELAVNSGFVGNMAAWLLSLKGETGAAGQDGAPGATTWAGITDKPTFAAVATSGSKADVGLGNVDNTSDANKPVSTAQATADALVASNAATDATTKANTAQANAIAASTPIAHAGSGGTAHANVVAAGASGFMTGADKTKLDGVATGANNYVHPANHPASIITQDASNRFVTDAEKATWNAKQPAGTYATGTGSATGVNTGDQVIPTTLPASDVYAWAKEATKPAYTASEVGLGNVNNTADADKPVSTATQTALDSKQATLVSATNIKTINGVSVLGAGDIVVGSSITDTDELIEGTTNKYFTESRVRNTLLTGLSTTLGTTVASTHSVLEGIGFLQKQVTDIASTSGGLGYSSRTSNTMLDASDDGQFIDIISGTFTQTFTAAATLGAGWCCYLKNSSTTGKITLDPNGAELIDGLSSFIMYPGELRLLICDGTGITSRVIMPFFVDFFLSGTFTKPPGYSMFGVAICGGGGGGGGGGVSGDGAGAAGGGGGAYREILIRPSQVPASLSFTVGAGGNGGGNTGLAGGAGGMTSISGILGYGTIQAGGGGGAPALGAPASGTSGGSGGGWLTSASGITAGTGSLTGFDNGLVQAASTVTLYGGAAGSVGGNNTPSNSTLSPGRTRHGGGGGGGAGGTSTVAAGNPSAGSAPERGVGGAAGVSGANPTSGQGGVYKRCGGGGGGSTLAAGMPAGSGGAGGPGGGGGAGGGSNNSTDGIGGAGGSGFVEIWGIV